jgi:hypothetical protein
LFKLSRSIRRYIKFPISKETVNNETFRDYGVFTPVEQQKQPRFLSAFLVTFLFMLLHDCPRRNFLGSLSITSGFLCGLFDVFVLALFLGANAA